MVIYSSSDASKIAWILASYKHVDLLKLIASWKEFNKTIRGNHGLPGILSEGIKSKCRTEMRIDF